MAPAQVPRCRDFGDNEVTIRTLGQIVLGRADVPIFLWHWVVIAEAYGGHWLS